MSSYLLQTILVNAILASLLAGGVLLASFLLARPLAWRPAVLHALWVLVLLKLLMPMSLAIPVLSIRHELGSHEELDDFPTVTSLSLSSPEASTNGSLLGALWTAASMPEVFLAVWMCGALMVAAKVAAQVARFSACIRKASPAPAWMIQEAEALAARLGMKFCPRVCIVDAQLSPLLWAIGSYAVVLPQQLTLTLSRSELRSILKHELMHLRRRDHWWRWLEVAAVITYWWLPLAWWARRQLRAAEELCCDLAVLEHWPDCAKEYAHTLLKSNDWLTSSLPVPQVASGFGSASLLKWRITMILSKRLHGRLSSPAKFGLLLAAVVVLPLSPMALYGEEGGSKTITIEVKKDGSIALHIGGPVEVKKEESATKMGVLYLKGMTQAAGSAAANQVPDKADPGKPDAENPEGADQKGGRPLNLSVQKEVVFSPDGGKFEAEHGIQLEFSKETPQYTVTFEKDGNPKIEGANVVITQTSPDSPKPEGAVELYLDLNSLKAKEIEIERKKAELAVLEAELKTLQSAEKKQQPAEKVPF